jgi:hypothetical protein
MYPSNVFFFFPHMLLGKTEFCEKLGVTSVFDSLGYHFG